eukprot:scaffold152999_cov27-Tisochrysis_lutea.AAC.4
MGMIQGTPFLKVKSWSVSCYAYRSPCARRLRYCRHTPAWCLVCATVLGCHSRWNGGDGQCSSARVPDCSSVSLVMILLNL